MYLEPGKATTAHVRLFAILTLHLFISMSKLFAQATVHEHVKVGRPSLFLNPE
jgi:hypothetical protein